VVTGGRKNLGLTGKPEAGIVAFVPYGKKRSDYSTREPRRYSSGSISSLRRPVPEAAVGQRGFRVDVGDASVERKPRVTVGEAVIESDHRRDAYEMPSRVGATGGRAAADTLQAAEARRRSRLAGGTPSRVGATRTRR